MIFISLYTNLFDLNLSCQLGRRRIQILKCQNLIVHSPYSKKNWVLFRSNSIQMINEIEDEFMSNLWCHSPANLESVHDQNSSQFQDFDNEWRQAITPVDDKKQLWSLWIVWVPIVALIITLSKSSIKTKKKLLGYFVIKWLDFQICTI